MSSSRILYISLNKVRRTIVIGLTQKKWRILAGWLLLGFGIVLMIAWNWKLVIATGAGVGLMLLIYRLLTENWQGSLFSWQKFLNSSDGKLTLAAGGGGFAALLTYLGAAIWAESENRWLATGIIFQGLGTIVTLGLLFWQVIYNQKHRDDSLFEQWLQDLTNKEPLKRLIAVRQLDNLVSKKLLNSSCRHQVVEYFNLLLMQEKEPLIREALLNSLSQCSENFKALEVNIPLQIPVDFKMNTQRVRD